jgi:hypothetical protein
MFFMTELHPYAGLAGQEEGDSTGYRLREHYTARSAEKTAATPEVRIQMQPLVHNVQNSCITAVAFAPQDQPSHQSSAGIFAIAFVFIELDPKTFLRVVNLLQGSHGNVK